MLTIGLAQYEQMIAHLEDALPLEGCGLLAGLGGTVTRIYPVDNALSSPHAYEMDPGQQVEAFLDLEKRGWELAAIYHSHPNGPDTPSMEDISKSNYTEPYYIIVSFRDQQEPMARAFTIRDGESTEVLLQVG